MTAGSIRRATTEATTALRATSPRRARSLSPATAPFATPPTARPARSGATQSEGRRWIPQLSRCSFRPPRLASPGVHDVGQRARVAGAKRASPPQRLQCPSGVGCGSRELFRCCNVCFGRMGYPLRDGSICLGEDAFGGQGAPPGCSQRSSRAMQIRRSTGLGRLVQQVLGAGRHVGSVGLACAPVHRGVERRR